MFYYLDLIGTLAFAIGGAYKAKSRNLNIFGVVLLGIITSIGGGTVRDLILGRTPLFYLTDPNYIIIGTLAGILTYYLPHIFKKTYTVFRFTDSIGIATFAIIGASVSYTFLSETTQIAHINLLIIATFLGTLTAVGGGVIRDAVMGDVPYALKEGSNYISSAFFGALTFIIIMKYNSLLAIIISFIITLVLREIISPHGLYKKSIKKSKTNA